MAKFIFLVFGLFSAYKFIGYLLLAEEDGMQKYKHDFGGKCALWFVSCVFSLFLALG
jgi:hypothetical protein